eukprot:scaffold825_cov30-Tisochrysis_lutea.AAC.3
MVPSTPPVNNVHPLPHQQSDWVASSRASLWRSFHFRPCAAVATSHQHITASAPEVMISPISEMHAAARIGAVWPVRVSRLGGRLMVPKASPPCLHG